MGKRVGAVLLAGMMTLHLAACGSGSATENENNSSTSSTSSTSSNSLTVAIWDTYQEPGLKKIMNDFTEETGIEVNIQVTPWDQYWTMLEAGATGGTLPDVFWMHTTEADKYIEYDMLMNLTERIKESDTIDMDNYLSDIAEIYQDSDGNQYAIPKDIDTVALWYNKTMFDEAGLSYPDETWTWDDFREAAKALTKDDGSQYGAVIHPKSTQESYYNLIFDYGGYVISDNKKTSGWDDENTINAIKFIQDMIEDGSMPEATTLAENLAIALFESGKVAMCPFGSWMISELGNNEYVAKNCDVAVLPSYEGTRISVSNGLGWAASANTPHQEEAWKLLEYLGSKEAQKKQADLGVTMSAFLDTSEGWTKSFENFNLDAYLEMMDDTRVYPYSYASSAWGDMTVEKMIGLYKGNDAETVCREIAEEMNAFLAEE